MQHHTSYDECMRLAIEFIGSPVSITKNIFFKKHIRRMQQQYVFVPWKVQAFLWLVWALFLLFVLIATMFVTIPLTIVLFGNGGMTDLQRYVTMIATCAIMYLMLYYVVWPLSFRWLIALGLVRRQP